MQPDNRQHVCYPAVPQLRLSAIDEPPDEAPTIHMVDFIVP